ncbi:polysaccharide deacetylase family protein [Pyrobaculum sp.]|uniref:polysaccharide deacetylase family protein n=1 Tax=Pyrobaculum sp. TaxID=2004705 RepID=UPI00316FC3AF
MYIALTFDDGYKEHLKIAKYLAGRGIRATFFVIAGLREYMGRKLLEPGDVRAIHEMGHEVGSHTMTHIDMTKTDKDAILEELIRSKEVLEDIIHGAVVSFAYPYGPHSDEAARLARSVYPIVRGTYLGDARHYRLYDEHGCVMAFNLRLGNLYDVLKLVRFNGVVLFTHAPSLMKLGLLLKALSILKPKYVTLREFMEVIKA